MTARLLAAALLLSAGTAAAAAAPPPTAGAPGVEKRTIGRAAFPEPRATVTVLARIAPGAEVAPHLHPGLESAYVVAGEARLRMKGAPDRRLDAGSGFIIPPERPHALLNAGRSTLVVVSTYVVDPSRPLASPSPF